jgi:hypothetical protein
MPAVRHPFYRGWGALLGLPVVMEQERTLSRSLPADLRVGLRPKRGLRRPAGGSKGCVRSCARCPASAACTLWARRHCQ